MWVIKSSIDLGLWQNPGIAGKTTTPVSTSFIIFSRCIFERGVSLGTITSLLDSLMHTPADLDIRLSSYPFATLDSVFMLHGTMSMPSYLKEPLDVAAAILSLL